MSLLLGNPELDTAHQLWPQQGQAEGQDHLPRPAKRMVLDLLRNQIIKQMKGLRKEDKASATSSEPQEDKNNTENGQQKLNTHQLFTQFSN